MRAYTAAEAIQMDRDSALHEALTYTAGQQGLTHQAERDIRAATMRHVDLILDLADAAVAARLELEAIDRRLDTHVRELHVGCTAERPCPRYRVMQIRHRRLQARYDAAYRALARGRR